MHTDNLSAWMHDHVFDTGNALAERSSRNSQIVADHHESKVASQKQADETAAKAAILRRIRSFFKL